MEHSAQTLHLSRIRAKPTFLMSEKPAFYSSTLLVTLLYPMLRPLRNLASPRPSPTTWRSLRRLTESLSAWAERR